MNMKKQLALGGITRSHITRQVYEEYQSQQLKSLPALDSCYSTELFNAYMEALHALPKGAAERTARKENLASVSVNREVRSDIRGAPFASG